MFLFNSDSFCLEIVWAHYSEGDQRDKVPILIQYL